MAGGRETERQRERKRDRATEREGSIQKPHLLYATSVGSAQTTTSSAVMFFVTFMQIVVASSFLVARLLMDPITPAATVAAICIQGR